MPNLSRTRIELPYNGKPIRIWSKSFHFTPHHFISIGEWRKKFPLERLFCLANNTCTFLHGGHKVFLCAERWICHEFKIYISWFNIDLSLVQTRARTHTQSEKCASYCELDALLIRIRSILDCHVWMRNSRFWKSKGNSLSYRCDRISHFKLMALACVLWKEEEIKKRETRR